MQHWLQDMTPVLYMEDPLMGLVWFGAVCSSLEQIKRSDQKEVS